MAGFFLAVSGVFMLFLSALYAIVFQKQLAAQDQSSMKGTLLLWLLCFVCGTVLVFMAGTFVGAV